MDTAGGLAKCKLTAEKAVKGLIGVIEPGLARVTTERFTTALLEARSDSLREFGTPYWAQHGPGQAYQVAEELAREVSNRRARGL